MLVYSEQRLEQNAYTKGSVSEVYFGSSISSLDERSDSSCRESESPECSLSYSIELKLSSLEGIGALRIPLSVELKYSEGYYTISNRDLDIHETGSTIHAALSNFEYFFAEDLRTWRESPDDQLTSDALALKKKYAAYVP
jgi:hypothetical protein